MKIALVRGNWRHPLPHCGCRRHPQCKPRSTFRLEMCQPMAPVLPVSERKLRHVAVWWAAPRQATACQYLSNCGTGGKAQGDVEINSNVRFSGGKCTSQFGRVILAWCRRAAPTGATTFWPRSEEHFLRLANIQTSR